MLKFFFSSYKNEHGVCRETGMPIGYIKNGSKVFYPYRGVVYSYYEIKKIISYLRTLNAKGPKVKVFLHKDTRIVYDGFIALGKIKENNDKQATFESFILRLDLTYLEQIAVVLKEYNSLQISWKKVGF